MIKTATITDSAHSIKSCLLIFQAWKQSQKIERSIFLMKMDYLILNLLLFVGLSSVTPLQSLYDIPDLSQKCKDGQNKFSADIEKCSNSVTDDILLKIQSDGSDSTQLNKDGCCSMKKLNKCFDVLKV